MSPEQFWQETWSDPMMIHHISTVSASKRKALNLLLALATTSALATTAHANDSAFSGVPGSPQVRQLKGEHPAIRMVSEKVVLTAGKKSFDTSANFVFRNESPKSVTVTMGFPETNYGDGWEEETNPKRSGFLRFATWVDGVRVNAVRTVVDPKNVSDAFWLKTVTFAPRQTKRVRVEITSPYGGTVEWGFNNCLSYSFTGENWKGKVDQSDLEVRVSEPGLWNAVGSEFGPNDKRAFWKPALQMQGKTAVLKRTWRNWQAQSSVSIGLNPTLPFWMVDPQGGISPVEPIAVRNTVTFRTGGTAGAPENTNPSMAPVFMYKNVPMVSFWYLKNRLERMSDSMPEGKQVKVSQLWVPESKEVLLKAGIATLGFKAGSDRMSYTSEGAKVLSEKLPVPAMNVKDTWGQNMLYVPLAPVVKAFGLRLKTDLPHRTFTLTRGTWPTIALQ